MLSRVEDDDECSRVTVAREARSRKNPGTSRRGREGVLESGICLAEARIKNTRRTASPGICDSIGMCRECPPGDVLTPCHFAGPRMPKCPFGTFLESARVSRRFEDGRPIVALRIRFRLVIEMRICVYKINIEKKNTRVRVYFVLSSFTQNPRNLEIF